MAFGSAWLLLLLSCAACTQVLGEIIMRPSCATGWFYHKSNCYGYFRKMRTWSDAELECQSHGSGSHLASILNLKEASVIAQHISSYQKNKSVWIGLHDPQQRQRWEWIDGTTYSYNTWASRSLGGSKYCAELSARNNFLTWRSRECSKKQHFVCKYRP
ncbi:regenerating islet-derived protein 4 [Talpa occidentalis]|uniref:regenerating islet-derived protein 4 n=1 Tax=Talpa occidentalis TaxID=50954 RepID=UPI00188FF2C8|nr:regenerating islet-derived protein 4 [Talpa occidentalis]